MTLLAERSIAVIGAGRTGQSVVRFLVAQGARVTVFERAATALDLTGKGTTLAKVAFAQYRVAPGNSVGFNANPNSSEWWTRFDWADLDGSGVWEPGEEGVRLGQRGGAAAESLDPHLRLPVVNEVAGWLEREVPAGIGLRTGVVVSLPFGNFFAGAIAESFGAPIAQGLYALACMLIMVAILLRVPELRRLE